MEGDPEGEDGRVFEPADHPVDFQLTGGGVGIASEGELGVGFRFEDERAGIVRSSLVALAEGGEGAGEMVEGVLTDAFDERVEGDAGIAEEMAEVGRRDRGELGGEIGELTGFNATGDRV